MRCNVVCVKTGWHWFVKYPPVLVRLLARRKTCPRSRRHIIALRDPEVAIGGGLPLRDVRRIQRKVDWDDVTIGDAKRFCKGCGFDPFNFRDRQRFVNYCRHKTVKWEWLHQSGAWESTFRPLIGVWRNHTNGGKRNEAK